MNNRKRESYNNVMIKTQQEEVNLQVEKSGVRKNKT